jgi:glycosyltransferase involved in cell wall biosynthesis
VLLFGFKRLVAVNALDKPSGKIVAFCGTRGVPANYGGFETSVDEISKRFVKSGFNCVVFCRKSASREMLEHHEGRRLVYVKGSSSRKLDTFISACQAGVHLLRHRRKYDYVFWFNNANLPGILLTLLARLPMSVNTDGLEWRRRKWKWPFKVYYLLASLGVARLCASVISDSKSVQSFYKEVFGKDTHLVPYGVPQERVVSPAKQSSILGEYGVESGCYLLQITRFEPDNLPLESAMAFREAGLEKEGLKLLLVGYKEDHPYARRVKTMSGRDGVLVTGAVYDAEVLSVLRKNCFCYIHGNMVGGTNPALLEAMAVCPRILAVDVPFSREVLGDTAHFFSPHDMTASFTKVMKYPDKSALLRERVHGRYQWDAVAESYMRLVEGQPADYSPLAHNLKGSVADR